MHEPAVEARRARELVALIGHGVYAATARAAEKSQEIGDATARAATRAPTDTAADAAVRTVSVAAAADAAAGADADAPQRYAAKGSDSECLRRDAGSGAGPGTKYAAAKPRISSYGGHGCV